MKKFYFFLIVFIFQNFTCFSQITKVNQGVVTQVSELQSTSLGLFFKAKNGSSTTSYQGFEAHVTDGTLTGTYMLETNTTNSPGFRDGLGPSVEFVEFNGKVYFRAGDHPDNMELWSTDGTQAGTTLVKDISTWGGGSAPNDITVVNNTLFFAATKGTEGRELWKSDGTDVGTVLVKDIYTGVNSSTGNQNWSNPIELYEFNNSLYFQANDGNTTGVEPWISDGTEIGTVILKDIIAGTTGSYARDFIEFNGDLYFGGREFYKSNGVVGNASMVKNINSSGDSDPEKFIVFDNKLFFSADDGVNGRELWRSNGATFGTQLFYDCNSGSNSGSPKYLTVSNSKLYFNAGNGSGRQLWVSDGTTAGTIPLVLSGIPALDPQHITSYNNKVYFNGLTASQSDLDRVLYESDGTVNGTHVVSGSPTVGFVTGNLGRVLTVHNNSLFFLVKNGSGNDLYKYQDPTLSSNQFNLDVEFKLYPNPSTSYFNIGTNETFDLVEIYNLLGEKVKSFNNEQEMYNVDGLESGVYFVRIQSGTKQITIKLIKK